MKNNKYYKKNTMKIELDYDKKTIKLGNPVELKMFVNKIKRILPDWEKWILDTNTEIIWNSPVIIRAPDIQPYIYTEPWWERTKVYYGDDKTDTHYSSTTLESEPVSGCYQIEIE